MSTKPTPSAQVLPCSFLDYIISHCRRRGEYYIMGFLAKKIFSNSLWMILEKVVSGFGVILVNAYMASYVGAEVYGKIVFSTVMFTFVQSLAWFGAQNVYFKRMSENPASGARFARATLKARRYLFAIASSVVLVYVYFSFDTIVLVFSLANLVSSYYLISDYVSIYNNSQLQSKINALTNIIGLGAALGARFLLAYFAFSVYWFVLPVVAVSAIPYAIRMSVYSRRSDAANGKRQPPSRKYNKYLFRTGGALLLSSLSIVIYGQISNIFLARSVSFSDLAVYNVAMTLGGAWSIVSTSLITSTFSRIYPETDDDKVFQGFKQINLIVVAAGICVGLGVLVFGELAISTLYGDEFIGAAEILWIVVLGSTMSGLGTICYRMMVKYGGYRYLSLKMFCVAGLSIPTSYLMIESFGVKGAAWCFVIVELFSMTFGNYFFRNGLILRMHLRVLGIQV